MIVFLIANKIGSFAVGDEEEERQRTLEERGWGCVHDGERQQSSPVQM